MLKKILSAILEPFCLSIHGTNIYTTLCYWMPGKKKKKKLSDHSQTPLYTFPKTTLNTKNQQFVMVAMHWSTSLQGEGEGCSVVYNTTKSWYIKEFTYLTKRDLWGAEVIKICSYCMCLWLYYIVLYLNPLNLEDKIVPSCSMFQIRKYFCLLKTKYLPDCFVKN